MDWKYKIYAAWKLDILQNGSKWYPKKIQEQEWLQNGQWCMWKKLGDPEIYSV